MSDYLTLNAAEFEAVATRLIEPEEASSVQLSRRDSLDNPYPEGVLIASVVPKFGQGEPFRVSVSEVGSISIWS